MDNEIMKAKKGKRRGGKKRTATKCREIRRRMGKAGIRTIRICPGKPARIVG